MPLAKYRRYYSGISGSKQVLESILSLEHNKIEIKTETRTMSLKIKNLKLNCKK